MGTHNEPSRRAPRFGYALGSAYRGFAYSCVSIFYLFYLTNIAHLPPTLAGGVLALPKIWDAFIDPILGTWIDRQAIRFGRRWPFLLAAGLTTLLSFIGLFSLPNISSHWAVAGIALVLLVINSSSETIFAVCHLSISAEITKEPHDLTGLFSLATTLFTIMNIVGSMLPPLIIAGLGGGRAAYSHMAIIGAILSLCIFSGFLFLTWRVPITPMSKEVSSLSLLSSFKAAGANRSFIFLLAYFIVTSAAASILSAFTPYATAYVLKAGSSGLAIFGGVLAAASIVGYPLAPHLVRWIGLRKALKLGNSWSGWTSALLFIASFGALWMNWVVVGLIGVVSGVVSVLILAALVGVSRAPVKTVLVVPIGFYYGMIVSGTKLGMSAGGLIAGVWLTASGFMSGISQQSPGTVMGIRVGYTLLIGGIFAVSNVLVNRIRPVSENGAREPTPVAPLASGA